MVELMLTYYVGLMICGILGILWMGIRHDTMKREAAEQKVHALVYKHNNKNASRRLNIRRGL